MIKMKKFQKLAIGSQIKIFWQVSIIVICECPQTIINL